MSTGYKLESIICRLKFVGIQEKENPKALSADSSVCHDSNHSIITGGENIGILNIKEAFRAKI